MPDRDASGPGATDRPGHRDQGAPVTVYQWAQDPGPVGGVTRSVGDLTAALRADGLEVLGVNTASPRRALGMLPRLWRRRALHVLHITRLWRGVVLAPLFAVLPGRVALVLHSGSSHRQVHGLSRLQARIVWVALRAYDEFWAVNGEIGALLPEHLRSRVRVVTPFVGGPPPADRQERDPLLVTVATNSGQHHYGAALAITAVARARESRPQLRLWVLAYGDDGALMPDLRAKIAGQEWIRLSFNMAPAQVADALARSGTFLRPTTWDGDALIVREALALGTRVVATDTAPRPAGVELCALDAEALATALLDGGRPSDGAGLATDSIVDAARRAVETVGR